MGEARGELQELLEHARARSGAGDHAGVARLLADVPEELLLAEPELGYHLAYAWRRTGRPREALTLTTRLRDPVRRAAAAWLERRRLNLEAMIRYEMGEPLAAAALWEELVQLCGESDDRRLLAAAHNNLGVAFTLHDRVDEAFATYQRALHACRGMGDRRGMAQAHQNLAILLRELGRTGDADRHFAQALHEARASASEDVRGRVEEERALLELDAGDARLAEALATRSLRRLRGIGDAAGEGEALRVLGIVALHQRRLDLARERLAAALDLAKSLPNPLLEGETCEALAVLEELLGGADAAAGHRQDAEARFHALHALPWGRRIRARTAALAALA